MESLQLSEHLLALGVVILGLLGEVLGHVLLHLEELGVLEHLGLHLLCQACSVQSRGLLAVVI